MVWFLGRALKAREREVEMMASRMAMVPDRVTTYITRTKRQCRLCNSFLHDRRTCPERADA